METNKLSRIKKIFLIKTNNNPKTTRKLSFISVHRKAKLSKGSKTFLASILFKN